MSVDRFFFTQLIQGKPDKDGKSTIDTVEDSVEFREIRRSRQFPDGSMLLVLKDGHEEARDFKRQTGKKETEVSRQRVYVQSEILIMPADGIRFRKITSTLNDMFEQKQLQQGDSVDSQGPATEGIGDALEPTMQIVGPDKFLNN